MNYDLIKIKEKYGEKMMHLCRSLFPTILEEEGLLFNILEDNFAYTKFLYEDIINNKLVDKFKNYIYNIFRPEKKEENIVVKTPKELLNEVGYDLYECKTESDIQQFKKYYQPGEQLCTFKEERLKNCYVFFAVKKNVEQIKRENFPNPQRQDEYGTSVISIQFTRGDINTISIKNRYNHKVSNPDSTFSNDLENIIEGLTQSFEKEYNLNMRKKTPKEFEIPGYVKASNGKFYKYNYEINNIYYCPNNIIIDNFKVVDKYREKEKYLIIDYLIIDLVNKQIAYYDKRIDDAFIKYINNIKKIEIIKEKTTKIKTLKIILENGTELLLEVNKYNRIVSYTNKNLHSIDDNFLHYNKYLEKINMPNVTYIGDKFLTNNIRLKEINIPNIIEIGNYFLKSNRFLEEINIPNIRKIGSYFLSYNDLIEKIDFPNLYEVNDNFFNQNQCINDINLPSLIKVKNGFLENNKALVYLNLPNLQQIGSNFLSRNIQLEEINIPECISIGNAFLYSNEHVKKIVIPNLLYVGNAFMEKNEIIEKLLMPNIIKIGNRFLINNNTLKYICLPKLETIGASFLEFNNSLLKLDLESLQTVQLSFLKYNNTIKRINTPKLEIVGSYFLYANNSLISLELPELYETGSCFLQNNNSILELYVPKLKKTRDGYLLPQNKVLEYYDLSSLQGCGRTFCKVKMRVLSNSD